MAWDDTKIPGNSLDSSEWNTHVIDQKTRQTAADVSTAITTALTNYSKISSGNYSTDSTQNKAIAHGLGIVPKFVICVYRGAIVNSYSIFAGNIKPSTGQVYTVTSWDATNFYVGNASNYSDSANLTGNTIDWIAFG